MNHLIRCIFVCCLLLLPMAPAHSDDSTLGVQRFTAVDDIAAAIAAHFPKVQGEVDSVQGDRITISLGSKDGIAKGMTLTVWRVSKEILHPVTNAVIGRTEEEAATIEAVKVDERTTEAVILKKLIDPRPGDKARITPKKLVLAVMPVGGDASDLAEELGKRLGESGRFTVQDAASTTAFLRERQIEESAAVKALGSGRNADVVVAFSAVPSQGKQLVTAKIFYADDGRMLDTLVGLLAPKQEAAAIAEVKPFFVPVKEEKVLSEALPVHAVFLAVADLDGDGEREYVFSDGIRLSVYRQRPGGWKEVWTEVIRGIAYDDIRHISIDAADLNGNGIPEIFATAMIGQNILSWVTEWKDGTFQRIAELPVFLRVVLYPGRGPMLIGQEYDQARFTSGAPKEYRWSNGTYVAGAEFPLPRGVVLYGFTFADFGGQKIYLVSRDRDDNIGVYSGDGLVWKGNEEYPSRETVVIRPLVGVDTITKPEIDPYTLQPDKTREVRIKGRMLAFDVDGDGRDEIILPKHAGGFLFLTRGETTLVALRWTGSRLEESWVARDISGTVQDIAVMRGPTGGSQVISLQRVKSNIISKGKDRVVQYNLR